MDKKVAESFKESGISNITYVTVKTLNRPLKSFFCTLYSLLRDVDAYVKLAESDQQHRPHLFRGFVTAHRHNVPMFDLAKLNNCIISRECFWNSFRIQLEYTLKLYVYYRDSLAAAGDVRNKVVSRLQETHYMVWGISKLFSFANWCNPIVAYLLDDEREACEKWLDFFDPEEFQIDLCALEIKIREFLERVYIQPATNVILEDSEQQAFATKRDIDNVLLFARQHRLTDV